MGCTMQIRIENVQSPPGSGRTEEKKTAMKMAGITLERTEKHIGEPVALRK